MIYKTRHAWAFLLPAIILLMVFSIIPIIWVIYLGFTSYNVFQPAQWVGLENYQTLLSDDKFWHALKNTMFYWILVTPAITIVSLLLAVLVNQQLKGIKLYRLAFYFPVLVSVVVTALLWKWMFATDGIFNYFFELIGIGSIKWLTSPSMAMISVAIVTVWQGMGYYMLIYLAGLQSVPQELYEAAEMDGAGFWRKQWNITIPSLRPVILFVSIISTMGAFKEFALMMVMTEGGPVNSTTTLVYLIFKEAFENINMGYASAIATILFLVILIISIVNLKIQDTKDA
ncbi:carbohydrate ABC transporter permease [Pseudogracilibacillus auburnensis]|uniref:Carbohydrate ABC transporter membrane protein 1 (CUT1 family) n=1 Tax=Pseudogracilibacillus auburnensis TaxID=1494959 RepID=A0A2V3VXA9_9BACI|nr:sugar ABC transporter permease [Pseudogracilibacillus auburnensis]PXW85574.1 carbohydrate ABC transporter membrane protein 1 (CUT1 family) [Pseudogracilibacillus auburnensis]